MEKYLVKEKTPVEVEDDDEEEARAYYQSTQGLAAAGSKRKPAAEETPARSSKKQKKETKKPEKKKKKAKKKKKSRYLDDEAGESDDESEDDTGEAFEVDDDEVEDEGDGLRPREKQKAEKLAAKLQAKHAAEKKREAVASEKPFPPISRSAWTKRAASLEEKIETLMAQRDEIDAEIAHLKAEAGYAGKVREEVKTTGRGAFVTEEVVYSESDKFPLDAMLKILSHKTGKADKKEAASRECLIQCARSFCVNVQHLGQAGIAYTVQGVDGKMYSVRVNVESKKDEKDRSVITVSPRTGDHMWKFKLNHQELIDDLAAETIMCLSWPKVLAALAKAADLPGELRDQPLDLAWLFLLEKSLPMDSPSF